MQNDGAKLACVEVLFTFTSTTFLESKEKAAQEDLGAAETAFEAAVANGGAEAIATAEGALADAKQKLQALRRGPLAIAGEPSCGERLVGDLLEYVATKAKEDVADLATQYV